MKYCIPLFALILLQSCNKVESTFITYKDIRYNIENRTEKENLLKNISKVLPENELNNGLQDAAIRKGTDDATGEEYTYLFSESQNKLFRLAVLLEYEANEKSFKIVQELFVMCYGTEDGNPERYNEEWFCHSPYKKGEDNFKSKKTVTLIIEE